MAPRCVCGHGGYFWTAVTLVRQFGTRGTEPGFAQGGGDVSPLVVAWLGNIDGWKYKSYEELLEFL